MAQVVPCVPIRNLHQDLCRYLCLLCKAYPCQTLQVAKCFIILRMACRSRCCYRELIMMGRLNISSSALLLLLRQITCSRRSILVTSSLLPMDSSLVPIILLRHLERHSHLPEENLWSCRPFQLMENVCHQIVDPRLINFHMPFLSVYDAVHDLHHRETITGTLIEAKDHMHQQLTCLLL